MIHDLRGPLPAPTFGASERRVAVSAVTVGPVRFWELRAVARLQRQAFRPALAYGPTVLALLWLLPQVRFVVARQDGHILGCAIGDRDAGHARVINLAVDPTARRRGIGSALLRALEAALPRGNVLLMVEQENSVAQSLYRREGYLPVGTAPNYYGPGRSGIWMQKQRTAQATAKLWR